MTKRRIHMASATVVTCLIIAVIIIVNVLFGALEKRVNLKIDMTPDSILSFSEPTVDVLKGLDEEVRIYSLIPEGDRGTIVNQLRDIVEKYVTMSPKIKYKVIDSAKNPDFLRKYTEVGSTLSSTSLIIETDKRFKVVDLQEAYTYYDMSYDENYGDMALIGAEKLITNAFLYVTNDVAVKIGVVEGHGGPGTEYFSMLLSPEGYDVEAVDLMTGNIPEDINHLIITAPQTDYQVSEIEKIDAFLDKGYSMQYIADLFSPACTSLETYLASDWGIEFKEGFIVEQDANHYTQSQLNLYPELVDCDINKNFINSGVNIVYPLCKGIKTNSNPYVQEQVLATTTDKAIVKINTNVDTSQAEIVPAEGDAIEKSNLATIVSKQIDDNKTAKVFVSGSIYFVSKEAIANSENNSNYQFYLNVIASVTNNERNMNVHIPYKDVSTPVVNMTFMEVCIYAAITILLIPIVLLIAGLVVWLRRRHL